MLILIINNNLSLNLSYHMELYFLYYTYCNKFNINYIYNDKVINNIFNIDNNLQINFNNYDSININSIICKFHNFLIENNKKDIDLIIYIDINKVNYLINNLIYYYINYNEVTNSINNLKFQIINYPIEYNFDYICIHIDYGSIINDPLNYKSFNSYIEQYNKLILLIKYNLPVIIITNEIINDIEKYINNFIIINEKDINEFDLFNIMIKSKYLLKSNSNQLDFYSLLLKDKQ
jgi:hypothetical protein